MSDAAAGSSSELEPGAALSSLCAAEKLCKLGKHVPVQVHLQQEHK